jgi:hypothetical protein
LKEATMPLGGYLFIEGVRASVERVAEDATQVFDQNSSETPDGKQLVIAYKGDLDADDAEFDLAADNGQEIGDPITFTAVIDTALPAVQYDHDWRRRVTALSGSQSAGSARARPAQRPGALGCKDFSRSLYT